MRSCFAFVSVSSACVTENTVVILIWACSLVCSGVRYLFDDMYWAPFSGTKSTKFRCEYQGELLKGVSFWSNLKTTGGALAPINGITIPFSGAILGVSWHHRRGARVFPDSLDSPKWLRLWVSDSPLTPLYGVVTPEYGIRTPELSVILAPKNGSIFDRVKKPEKGVKKLLCV